MNLDKYSNIMRMRAGARAALPDPMYHYLEGGADDEWTMQNNTDAFDKYELMPYQLRDTSGISMKTKILGCDIDMPVFLAPTGMSRLFHHEKEIGAANAAARAGTYYSLSTLSTTSIEEIGALTSGPKMFQIYIHKDRGLTREFIARCKEAKYDAICLTVDTVVAGNRERDIHTGMGMPPRLTLKSMVSFLTHFGWTMKLFTKNKDFKLANLEGHINLQKGDDINVPQYIASQFDRTLTWKDAEWIASEWGGPFAIKGIQAAEDAKQAKESGASAIMISNHGGRQLESAPAPIDCVPPMRDLVGDSIELIVDGGVRRGTHVAKALALGADACSVGRPYLYALATAGEAGVDHALNLFHEELERTMILMGVSNVKDLSAAHIVAR